jgi:hypothetical protein
MFDLSSKSKSKSKFQASTGNCSRPHELQVSIPQTKPHTRCSVSLETPHETEVETRDETPHETGMPGVEMSPKIQTSRNLQTKLISKQYVPIETPHETWTRNTLVTDVETVCFDRNSTRNWARNRSRNRRFRSKCNSKQEALETLYGNETGTRNSLVETQLSHETTDETPFGSRRNTSNASRNLQNKD